MAEPFEIALCARNEKSAAEVNCAGIILAAGASRRMGRPKAALPFQGETFLGRLIGVLEPVCDPVIVVLGHDADTLRPQLPARVQVAVNPEPERGQLSSLQCALRALPPSASAFLFTPVDYPAIQPATVRRLSEALEQQSACLLAVPVHGGKRGHPVACRRELAEEFLALPPEGQAREVVRRHAARTAYVEIDDPGILLDVDDPAAYQALLALGTGQ